jgi:hypothetical protein
MVRIRPLALVLIVVASCLGRAEAQVAWESSYESAMARAREQGRVVFIAVNMDGEGANDHLAQQVYLDKRIAELTSSTVNLVASRSVHAANGPCKRFAGVACDDHKRIEASVRGSLVKEDESGYVVAPQHVLLSPAGEVILSVPYLITVEELAWCLVTARRTLASEAGLAMPEDATPPRRLSMKGVDEAAKGRALVRPLSEDELESTIKTMRKGWGAIEDLNRFHQILATDHPVAIKFATSEINSGMSSYSSEMTCLLVRAIASYSPPSFAPALEPCLRQQDAMIRSEAAAALEQLADKDSIPAIRKALSKEDSVEVKCGLLRALGAAGARNASIAKTLMTTARSEDDADLRVNAVLALAYHVERKEVCEFLVGALADEDLELRQAAALAMAFSRLAAFTAPIGDAAKAEQDPLVSALYARAGTVLSGGNLSSLADDYKRIGRDRVRRVRYFGDE